MGVGLSKWVWVSVVTVVVMSAMVFGVGHKSASTSFAGYAGPLPVLCLFLSLLLVLLVLLIN